VTEDWRNQPITKGKLHDTFLFAADLLETNTRIADDALSEHRGMNVFREGFRLTMRVVAITLRGTAAYLKQED
jgi:hypothetical protein